MANGKMKAMKDNKASALADEIKSGKNTRKIGAKIEQKTATATPGHDAGLVVWLLLLMLLLAGGLVAGFFYIRSGGPLPEPVQDAVEQAGWTVPDAGGDLPVLVLDAGHGGKDPGAQNRDESVYERDLNRDMFNRVCALLEVHQDSLKVVATTEEGEYVKPQERAERANAAGAQLVVSLHLNSDSSPKVRGFECYAQPPRHDYHAASRSFAKGLAKRIGEDTSLPVRGQDGVFYTFYVPSGGGYRQEIVPSNEVEKFGHPGASTFGLLEDVNCPAVLVEQWYISNNTDMKLCNNEAYKDKIAVCIYRSICKYFGLSPQY